MPERLCPTCQHPWRLLPDSSAGAQVEYYRCDACWTVWAQHKGDPLAPARVVLRRKSDTRSAKPPPTPNPPD